MITNGQVSHSPTKRTNPFAIAALVCGIAQFGYLLYKPLAPIGLAAIIFGHIATRQIRRTGQQGHKLARAGLILGYAVLVLAGLLPMLLLLAMSSGAPGQP